jgi:hypothetical protein
MSLSKPSFFSTSNGDGCVFISWSPVINATQYEIELEITSTKAKSFYCTTSTSLMITKLENDIHYSVRVTALHNTKRSEPSIGVMIRPKLRLSFSKLSASPTEQSGQVRLQWTSTPTDFGFQIERCDVGNVNGYKRIAWLPYNIITTYEDQTGCNLSRHVCPGHYYTVTFRDAAWSSGAGILSKKVFCMSSIDSDFTTEVENVDLLYTNSPESDRVLSEQSSMEIIQ